MIIIFSYINSFILHTKWMNLFFILYSIFAGPNFCYNSVCKSLYHTKFYIQELYNSPFPEDSFNLLGAGACRHTDGSNWDAHKAGDNMSEDQCKQKCLDDINCKAVELSGLAECWIFKDIGKDFTTMTLMDGSRCWIKQEKGGKVAAMK